MVTQPSQGPSLIRWAPRGLLTVVLLAEPFSAVAQSPSCEQWNTKAFFLTATAADVAACLRMGRNANARAGNGYTPLDWAVEVNEDPTVTETLLAAGAGIEALARKGRTPLHRAVRYNTNPAVIEALLSAGANIEAQEPSPYHYVDGGTPLHIAALTDNQELLEVLLAAGADPNSRRNEDGETPIFRASAVGIQALLAAGADVKARGGAGFTPLHLAVGRGPAVVELLLAAGADVHARARYGGQTTPLHYAARWSDSASVIELLLAAGADVGARDSGGRTVLHYAAERNTSPPVIEALVAGGASVNARDDEAETALQVAGENPNPVVREILRAAKADVNARDTGRGEALPGPASGRMNVLSVDDEARCYGRPRGSACWIELANEPGCDVWTAHLKQGSTVTWMGECSRGYAQGPGRVVWQHARGRETGEGPYVDGKRHGNWVSRFADGGMSQGSYVAGEKHGDWMIQESPGEVHAGPYVGGEKHGDWIEWDWNGTTRTIAKGPMVHGERHGDWVGWYTQMRRSFTDATIIQTTYVDGVPHGPSFHCTGREHGYFVSLWIWEYGTSSESYDNYRDIKDPQLARTAADTCDRLVTLDRPDAPEELTAGSW